MTRAELVDALDRTKIRSDLSPSDHSLIRLAVLMLIDDSQECALADQLAAALREARYRLRLIGLDLDDDGIATLATYEARRES